MGAYDDALAAAAAVADVAGKPALGVVLGSGLGAFVDAVEGVTRVPFTRIPGLPPPRVEGHAGAACFGRVGGVLVAVLAGRVHVYEGHDLDRVTLGVRMLALLGVRALVLTNAAGGIREDLTPGTLMAVTDHLNLMGRNPLVGPADPRLGPRFPDLSAVYDPALRAALATAATLVRVPLAEGVYAALSGPSYETPAEIRMLATLGADAVGMSTVPEAIAARQMGVRVAAVSCISNHAAGRSPRPLSHQEVMEETERASRRFIRLLIEALPRIAQVVADAPGAAPPKGRRP